MYNTSTHLFLANIIYAIPEEVTTKDCTVFVHSKTVGTFQGIVYQY